MKTIAQDLHALLGKGAVRFTFIKKDGSVRTAYGTRNPELISNATGVAFSESTSSRPNPNAFYDLEKMAWRSYIPENVTDIIG